jgi:hypothetical protein
MKKLYEESHEEASTREKHRELCEERDGAWTDGSPRYTSELVNMDNFVRSAESVSERVGRVAKLTALCPTQAKTVQNLGQGCCVSLYKIGGNIRTTTVPVFLDVVAMTEEMDTMKARLRSWAERKDTDVKVSEEYTVFGLSSRLTLALGEKEFRAIRIDFAARDGIGSDSARGFNAS